MQIVINVDAALGRKLCLLGALALGIYVLGPTVAGATVPNTFTPGTTISASAVNGNFAALDSRIAALETLLAGVTRASSTITFTGVNVQIKNGSGATDTADGTGNLIIGHNENTTVQARTGSHNLVVGKEHGWTSYSGVVTGRQNAISAEGAALLGGRQNSSNGPFSVIVGGELTGIASVGSPNETGLLASCFGCINTTDTTEDKGLRIGTNANGIGVGYQALLLEVGNFAQLYAQFGARAGNVDVGRGVAGNVNLGAQATFPTVVSANNVVVGQNAVTVQIGQQAQTVGLGVAAVGTVSVGTGAAGVQYGP